MSKKKEHFSSSEAAKLLRMMNVNKMTSHLHKVEPKKNTLGTDYLFHGTIPFSIRVNSLEDKTKEDLYCELHKGLIREIVQAYGIGKDLFKDDKS